MFIIVHLFLYFLYNCVLYFLLFCYQSITQDFTTFINKRVHDETKTN